MEMKKEEMMKPFKDIWTGLIFTPSLNGEKCIGNGKHKDSNGKEIEICCDNCSAFMCCFPQYRI